VEDHGNVVFEHKVKVAHGNVARSDCLDMNDLAVPIGLNRPGRSAQFAQKDPPNVFGIHDSRGAFNQFPTIDDAKPYSAGIGYLVNL
jgi:hypothetical protein